MHLGNPNTIPAAPVKMAINVGGGFDVPTGGYLKGTRGEHILNGGHLYYMGVVGIGNNYKSTLMHFFTLTALSRMPKACAAEAKDTEENYNPERISTLAARIPEFQGEDIILTERFKIVDKVSMSGTKWYTAHKDYMMQKRKEKAWVINSPFLNREGTGPLPMIYPTFSQIDSFTEYQTDDVAAINDKVELGSSDANTMYMRQGLAKNRMVMDAPALNAGSFDYGIWTAHLGKETTMQNAGPAGSVPITKLASLKNGDKIKGTTDKFTFVTLVCWNCYNTKPLINDGTKGPEYPRDSDDALKFDTDLVEIKVRAIRSKTGATGLPLTVVASQSEGVLPSLTEFHHIKTMDRYGLEGSNISYSLAILPEVKLSRTTVRGKIDADPILRRALNITSEMCQMSYLWHHVKPVLCTPKELYEDLKAMGYEWDTLLRTRGWWTPLNNEEGLPPFLSTWDLLLMRLGDYIPFWFTPEQKAKIDLSKAKTRRV